MNSRADILEKIRKSNIIEEICDLSLKYLYEARDEYKIIIAEEKLRRYMIKGCKAIENEVEKLLAQNSDIAIIDTYKNTVAGMNDVLDKSVNKGDLSYAEYRWFQREIKILLSKIYNMEDVKLSKYLLNKIKNLLGYVVKKESSKNENINSKVLELIQLFIELFNDVLYQKGESWRSLIHDMGSAVEEENPCGCSQCSDKGVFLGQTECNSFYRCCYEDSLMALEDDFFNDPYDGVDYYPEHNRRSDNCYSEHNLRPNNADYEFSVSEALDNMYGK